MKCVICSSKDLEGLFTSYDDRYGYQGRFKILECAACGHRMLDAGFSREEFMRLYSEYYPRSAFDAERYEPYKEVSGFWPWLNGEYFAAFRWVPRDATVLDIGCGFGETLGYHKARGCDVYGVEADTNIKRVAEKFGFNVHVGLFDPTSYRTDFFDYVTMDQVLEHVADPVDTMKGAARVLKPGGRLILSMPNAGGWGASVFGKKWVHWHIPYHLQHFTFRSLRIAAKNAGLEIERHKTITDSAWLYLQWMHLFFYPAENKASDFWSGKYQLQGRRDFFFKITDIMTRYKINHMITRFFDSINMGDNMVIILRKPVS